MFQHPKIKIWLFSLILLFVNSGCLQANERHVTALAWIAEDQGAGHDFVLPGHSLQTALRQASGVQLHWVFPLLDLTDQAAVPVDHVWGGFSETLLSASERYQPDLVVAVRYEAQVPGRILWYFWQEGRRSQFETQGDDPAQQATEFVEHLLKHLSLQSGETRQRLFPRTPRGFQPVEIAYQAPGEGVVIHGLHQPGDYLAVLEVLRALPGVQQVLPQSFQQGVLEVRLLSEASVDELETQLLNLPGLRPAAERRMEFNWN